MRPKDFIRGAALAVTLTLAGGAAHACPDAQLPPGVGDVTLAAGFTPDPYEFNVIAGGAHDIATCVGNGWGGTVNAAPDLDLYWEGTSDQLILSVEADVDSVLLVNSPSGTWLYDDDSGGDLDASIAIDNPQEGLYSIWVGTYGRSADATLSISELGGGASPQQFDFVGDCPDFSRQPDFGDVSLSAGFLPDPSIHRVSADGESSIANCIDQNWGGAVAVAPDLNLFWTGSTGAITITTDTGVDAVLLVNTPSGEWLYNDDSADSLEASLTINAPEEGRYDIWVGSYGARANGQVLITETAGAVGGATNGCPDWTATPTYGDLSLSAGFLPDPQQLRIVAGGAASIDGCIGNGWGGTVAVEPDVDLYWDGSSSQFTVSVETGVDSVLLINDPNGNWIYDDDGGQGLEASITVRKPLEGLYNIWIGTYGENAQGTLSITER